MTYCVLLIATLCIELAMNLPVGSLPLLLDGEHVPHDQIALAMGAGMATVVFTSLPIGALVDKIGRLPTMRLALFVALLALLGLTASHGPICGGILMGFRAIALVSFMTAQAAYVSLLVPPEKSVSAVATMGITGNLAFAMGPACSVWLLQHGFAREQFIWATAVIFVGILIVSWLPKQFDVKPEKTTARRTIIRREWLPALLFAISGSLQGGVNVALAILTFHERGIANGAMLFTASAITTVIFRYHSGIAVERFGPHRMAIPMALSQGLGCMLAATAHTMPMVIAAGAAFGLGWALIVPVVLGLLFEESTNETRGAAMGAFHFAFGVGSSSGAILATLTTMFGHGYEQGIGICAVSPLLALPFVLASRGKPAPKLAPELFTAE